MMQFQALYFVRNNIISTKYELASKGTCSTCLCYQLIPIDVAIITIDNQSGGGYLKFPEQGMKP
jgi:hypothetical protein